MAKGDQSVTIAALLEAKGFLSGASRVVSGIKKIGATAAKVTSVTAKIFTAPLAGAARLAKSIFSLRGLLFGLASLQAVNVFANFEAGIAQVSTLVNTAEVDIRRLADGVLDIGTKTGDSFDSLNTALFDTVSAGVAAGDALKFLDTAARLAAGGGTTTGEAVKGVVALINAYGLSADDAESVSDSLFKAMQGGITTIGLLSSNIGKVAPVARQAGLSLDEMLAAVSALTKGGLSTEEAVTALRATLSTLISPNEQAQEAARDLGIEWDSQALRAKGLLGVLQQLSRDGIRPTVEQQAALAGSSKAFVGVASLAADEAKNFRDILASMAEKAGATDEAFNKVAQTTRTKLNVLQRTFEKLFIVVGDAAKPFLDNTINALTRGIDNLTARRADFAAFFAFVGSVFEQISGIAADVIAGNNFEQALAATVVGLQRLLVDLLTNLVPPFLRAGFELGRTLATGIVEALLEELSGSLSAALTGGGVQELLAGLIISDDQEDTLRRIGNLRREIDKLNESIEATPSSLGDAIAESLGRPELAGPNTRTALTQRRDELQRQINELIGSTESATARRIKDSTAAVAESFSAGLKGFRRDASQTIDSVLGESGLSTDLQNRIKGLFDKAGDAADDARKVIEAEDLKRALEAEAAAAGPTQSSAIANLIEAVTEEIEEKTADQEAAVKTAEQLAAEAADRLRRAYDNASALSGAAPAAALFANADAVNQALAEAGRVGFNTGVALVDSFGLAIQEEAEDGTVTAKLRSLTDLVEANLVGFTVDAFSNLQNSISGLLTDAFTGDFENITERFRQFATTFLADFANFVARIITQALALQFVRFLLPGLFNEGGSVGSGGGGSVPLQRLLGLNSGGGVPGPNVNRDVVPALLTPGEFVLNRAATRYYSERFLEAMNARLIPKSRLADVARSVRTNLSGRFNSGGSVSSGLTQRSDPPTLVANEQTLARLLAGGSAAFSRYVAENPDVFRGLSGAARR